MLRKLPKDAAAVLQACEHRRSPSAAAPAGREGGHCAEDSKDELLQRLVAHVATSAAVREPCQGVLGVLVRGVDSFIPGRYPARASLFASGQRMPCRKMWNILW